MASPSGQFSPALKMVCLSLFPLPPSRAQPIHSCSTPALPRELQSPPRPGQLPPDVLRVEQSPTKVALWPPAPSSGTISAGPLCLRHRRPPWVPFAPGQLLQQGLGRGEVVRLALTREGGQVCRMRQSPKSKGQVSCNSWKDQEAFEQEGSKSKTEPLLVWGAAGRMTTGPHSCASCY